MKRLFETPGPRVPLTDNELADLVHQARGGIGPIAWTAPDQQAAVCEALMELAERRAADPTAPSGETSRSAPHAD